MHPRAGMGVAAPLSVRRCQASLAAGSRTGCLLLACVTIGCGGEPLSGPSPVAIPSAPAPTQAPAVPAATGQPAVVLAAGDIGMCGSPGAVETGQLLDRLSGTVLALGDLAYPSGRDIDFADCYDPVWGRHKARTRPAPGNHEYESTGALPYFDYFGPVAGPRGQGFYSFEAGDWLVLSLNSNIGMAPHSSQGQWLRSQFRLHPARCTLAYVHHPLVSSGPNGANPKVAELWQLLHEYGVDVMLVGHDHLYERFAPMDAGARRDDERGIRQFIAGTGGAPLYGVHRVHPLSEVRISAHGLLRLTLDSGAYEWEFLEARGGSTDSGKDTCH